MAIVIGLDAKLFIGTAGSTASTELDTVKNVTLSLESGEADITTRKSEGWRVYAATLKEGTLEFEMNYDTEDSNMRTIQRAWLEHEAVSFFVTDGNGAGLDADFVITNFSVDQPLEEASTVSVTARPTIVGAQGRAPKWTTSGG